MEEKAGILTLSVTTVLVAAALFVTSGPAAGIALSFNASANTAAEPVGAEDSTEVRGGLSETGTRNRTGHIFPAGEELTETFSTIGTVNGLMIERGGEILLEHYLDRMDRNRTVNTKSASKSIISLLTGIAIDEGYLHGVDQTLGELFPEYFESSPDPEKASITIDDLLTMRSGLETTSYYNYGPWVTSRDWVEFTLNQPMMDKPGGQMIYSTGTSHLLSVIITEASGMSTLEFAQTFLLDPLGIEPGFWERDPNGYYMGGNNLFLSPAALLKIGRMVMNGGRYDGRQIVSEKWIHDSLQIYTRSNYNLYDYGYMWWKRTAGGYDISFAWGYGGQFILMIPDLDTVIAITSDAEQNDGSREYEKLMFAWLEEQVIPLLEPEKRPGVPEGQTP